MRRTVQTRLGDFDEDAEKKPASLILQRPKKEKGQIWRKTTRDGGKWGVVRFDDTVLFVRVIDGRIYTSELEALCKWCEGTLEIRDDKVFCADRCKRYQGDFAWDLNTYLRWEGAKSFTLRHDVAKAEKIDLEARDLEKITYAPRWTAFDEYDEDNEY